MQDAGLKIEALNGFPGPYTKYVMDTIGAAGILRLMASVENRHVHFEQVLGYADEYGNVSIFPCEQDAHSGVLLEKMGGETPEHSWGEIWRIYQPDWADRPLSEILSAEADEHWAKVDHKSEFAKFAAWLKSR
jgi:inosine/xanthosine triphosphate pyrophosphatase family protein